MPEKSSVVKSQNGLDYPILFDKGNGVVKQFGIAFPLAEPLRPIRKEFNMDIPTHNDDESFGLPIPATYVVNRNNEIVFVSVNPNWMERVETKDYIEMLK